MNILIVLCKKCVSARHDSEIWLYTAEMLSLQISVTGFKLLAFFSDTTSTGKINFLIS